VDELLFNDGDLRLALEAQARRMLEAIEAESEASLKQVDVEVWAAALAYHFAVECPELHAQNVWREPVKDMQIDVSGDRGRYFSDQHSALARNFPGYRVVVHVPFEGDMGVFSLRPSSRTFNPPRAQATDGDLILHIEYARDSEPDIDGQVNAFLGMVENWLGFARADIDSFNGSLETQARQAIDARRQRIEDRDANLARSSIPERRRGESDTKTYIPDALVRRPAPSLPQTRADDKPPTLEPVLEESVFEHILSIIRMQARQMEQSPSTYKGMGEENRRQTIVATLNTHYEGRAAAEAFNFEGKTDILIRFEGRNLFICECKFWTGEKGFSETIDQLFRYTGWHDTKLAIVMFIREKGLSAILKKAAAALEGHSQFSSRRDAATETELRAAMRWPGDEERLADLNVFLVHTPEN